MDLWVIVMSGWLVGWLVGWVLGISSFVGYLMPNPWVHSLIVKTFLFQAIQFIQAVLIQLIQFSISTDFVYTQLNVKTVLW